MWDLEVIWLLYNIGWLVFIHFFIFVIRWCRYLFHRFIIFLHYTCHLQKNSHYNTLLQSQYNWRLYYLLYLLFLVPVACHPGLQVSAIVWLYLVWLVFLPIFDALQPCWYVNIITHDHYDDFLLGADKRNPIIRVRLCSCAVACCEIAHILLSDVFSGIHSPTFPYE